VIATAAPTPIRFRQRTDSDIRPLTHAGEIARAVISKLIGA
jgi:hypothetical protein